MTAIGHRQPWLPVYVGLGSNLESPEDQVRRAFDELARLEGARLVARSALYASPPMGPQDQPPYVNAVAGLLATCTPEELLARLQGIEQRLGRRQGMRWGPRIIDLDILVFGSLRIDRPGLTIPHPGIAERAFVLRPLADLAPDLEVPGRGRVRALLAGVDTADLARLKG